MPRLRNSVTGVTVNVSEEKAASMPDVWAPVAAVKKAAKKRAPRKKATTSITNVK